MLRLINLSSKKTKYKSSKQAERDVNGKRGQQYHFPIIGGWDIYSIILICLGIYGIWKGQKDIGAILLIIGVIKQFGGL